MVFVQKYYRSQICADISSFCVSAVTFGVSADIPAVGAIFSPSSTVSAFAGIPANDAADLLDLPFGFCSAGETAECGKKYQGRES